MAIFVGTAGWSYPSGAGTWNGRFYPAGLPDAAHLSYYAERFDAVEVNSTFYRPLNPDVARSWLGKTPDYFRFCLKLFQKFTHPRMYREAVAEPTELAEQDYQDAFRGLEPLAASGRLGALLAQFPPSFKATPSEKDHLEQMLRRFAAYPVAVELRHRSWTEDLSIGPLLSEYGAAWTMIDEPKFKTSIGEVPLTSQVGYFRFHGRNYKQWWTGDRETRYDYLYSASEQTELAVEVRTVADRTAETFVFYNNHYGAKATANAVQLKALLDQPVGVELAPELLADYPFLDPSPARPTASKERP